MMRVAVTGATGFIGRHVCYQLCQQGIAVKAIVRQKMALADWLRQTGEILDSPLSACKAKLSLHYVADLYDQEALTVVLRDVDVVVHLAAKVHAMSSTQYDHQAYVTNNIDHTLSLAKAAMGCGVKRFIFISTIKVNGDTSNNRIFRADDVCHPQDSYSLSKYRAELALQQLCQQSTMDHVVIRPTIVYGAGVKGNFLQLLAIAAKGSLLPFAAIKAKRSFTSVDNLSSLIIACLTHSAASNQTFLVSDGQDLSLPELLAKLRYYCHKPNAMFWLPVWLLWLLAWSTGNKTKAQRLLQPLQVDIQMTKETLNWQPSDDIDHGLQKTVAWFVKDQKK